METLNNFKKFGKKDHYKYTILVIWLIIGTVISQLALTMGWEGWWAFTGIFSLLPLLAFMMYLIVYSFISKREVRTIPSWQVVLLFALAIPLMLLILPVFIIFFAVAIVSYFFLSSWFLLYGSYRSSRKLDNKLKKQKHNRLLRSMMFFGGITLALLTLYGLTMGPAELAKIVPEEVNEEIINYIPDYLTVAYFAIGSIFAILTVIAIILMFKRIFNAWLGFFFIMVDVYLVYLVARLILAHRSVDTGGETTSSITMILIMLVLDIFILIYTASCIMGSNADLLTKRLRRFKRETILLWLLFSKAAYEIVHYFPYGALGGTWFDWLSWLNEDWINWGKNFILLGTFVLILLVMGIHQIRMYSREERRIKKNIYATIDEMFAAPVQEEEITSGEYTMVVEQSFPEEDRQDYKNIDDEPQNNEENF